MIPAIIDHPTLTRWANRQGGVLPGDLLAGVDALITTALRYDDAVVITRAQARRIKELEDQIAVLKLESDEASLRGCRKWGCGERK